MAHSQPGPDIFLDADPEMLATFVQEYVRREDEADAGTHAIIASQLRDPRWLPHQMAEMLLAKPEIQAAVQVLRSVYKPKPIAEVSVATISADMEVLYQEAKNARQFTAAISAKKLQAELHGMISKDITVRVTHSVASMADSELEAIARRGIIEGEFVEVAGLPAVVTN